MDAQGPPGLRLVPLTAASVRALVAEPGRSLTEPGLTGLGWPEEDRRVLRYRSEALAADPAAAPWLLHVAVDEQERLVGRIGCHSAPVDDRVEVGSWVGPDFRGRGVATWLLAAFSAWLQESGVRTVVLTVGPANAPSLGIARRAGFVHLGERWDEEDGTELVLERDLLSGRRAPPRGRPPAA